MNLPTGTALKIEILISHELVYLIVNYPFGTKLLKIIVVNRFTTIFVLNSAM